MKVLQYINKMLDIFLRTGIILVTISIILSMTLQVCSRYFFTLPFYGFDEFTGHTAVWFYFLGAAYSAAHKDHIKADMLDLFRIPPKGQYFFSLFATFVSIVISGFMISWSYDYVIWSIGRNELTPSLLIPTVYFQFAILLGAVLMFVYFIKEFYEIMTHQKVLHNEKFESLVSNR